MLGLLLLPTDVQGQVRIGGQTESDQEQPVLLKADSLRQDRELGLIIASGNVEIARGGRLLLADAVTYNQRTETVTASGNISMMEPSGEVFFADFVELSDDLKDGIVEGIRVLLPDRSRIAAVGGRLVAGIRKTMRKAVYSPCEICKEHPDRPPTWQIKAFEVVHDRANQEIEYKDAWLEFYGVPVVYMPYFFHPDSTVKRKTGLLTPSFGISSVLGTMIRVPFHYAISPTTDATITPIFTSKEGPVLFVEHRNRFVGGLFEGRGSITHGTGFDAESKVAKGEDDEEIRGHFKGRLGVDIDDTWRTGTNLEFASDETYLRRYGFGGGEVLTNHAFIEGFRDRNYSAANAYFFQDQRSDVSQKTVPLVVPKLDYAFVGQPGRYGGRWSVDANLLNLLRNTGTDTRRLSFRTEWQMPYTSRIGELYTMFASLQTDAYWVDKLADPEDPSQTFSGLTGRFFPQVGLDWRFPLARSWGRLAHVVEPIAGVIVGPNGGNPDEIPNEDSIDFELDDTNIFSRNRFTGLDRVEGGPRAYFGLKTSIYGAESGHASVFLGQGFRLEDDGTFLKSSGLDDHFSDFVGRTEISIPKYLDLLYRFRVDNQEFDFKRNELTLTGGVPEFRVSANYLFVDQEEQSESESFNSREEITLSMASRITERWSIGANTRRNLAKDGGSINHGFRLTYQDSCFLITGSFTRTFTEDRDIKPTDTLLVQVTLRTLGSFAGGRVLSQPSDDSP